MTILPDGTEIVPPNDFACAGGGRDLVWSEGDMRPRNPAIRLL